MSVHGRPIAPSASFSISDRRRVVTALGGVLLSAALATNPAAAVPFLIVGAPGVDLNPAPAYYYSFNFKNFSTTRYDAVRVNGSGTAVSYSSKIGDFNAVRWDGSGLVASELPGLEDESQSIAYDVNESGTVVGQSRKLIGPGSGERAVRWDAAGTITLLDTLYESGGTVMERAVAINDAGTAVGFSGSFTDQRAVLWDGSGTAVTELENLGTRSDGSASALARAVNLAGTAVGESAKFSNGNLMGTRAVRWDAAGTVATELGHLGTDPKGMTSATAIDLNDAGTAVGIARKYFDGSSWSQRVVRWDASGTDATELGVLGDDDQLASATANAVNSAGTAVGFASSASGGSTTTAVRWDAGSTVATALESLDASPSDNAYDINDAGFAVGFSHKYHFQTVSHSAVIWTPTGRVIDLNSLDGIHTTGDGNFSDLEGIDTPEGKWLLTQAHSITNNGWISGMGYFQPAGTVQNAYWARAWSMQLDLSAIPEPNTSLLLSAAALAGALNLRRRNAASRLRFS